MQFGPWTKIGSDEIIRHGRRRIRVRRYRLPDGREHDFTVKDERDVVLVFALTVDRKVVLAKQFRPGPERVCLELPGGGLEDGEMPIQGARRELLEETGYVGDIVGIGTALSCAYSTRTRHYFVATNCRQVEEPKGDSMEFIEPVEYALGDFRALLLTDQISDPAGGFRGLMHLGLLVPAP